MPEIRRLHTRIQRAPTGLQEMSIGELKEIQGDTKKRELLENPTKL